MAQFQIYRSSDGSAPTLDGTVGSLVALLDACLVTGYGAKTAAGWSKPFTGTNKAAFRPGAGTRLYLRVQDDAPGAGGAKEARLTGYETMSDVDTGTGPFPTAAQALALYTFGAAFLVARKSASADGVARTWTVIADSRTAYIFVLTGDAANNYFAFSFGDIFSFKADDAYNCLIIGRIAENSATAGHDGIGDVAQALSTVGRGHFIARGHTQLGGSVNIGKHIDSVKTFQSDYPVGVVPFTNPEDGGIYLAPCWVHDPTTVPVNGCRGRLRGIWVPLHPVASLTDGDTFSGGATGELVGKTFLVVKLVNGQAGAGVFAVETSNTLEST